MQTWRVIAIATAHRSDDEYRLWVEHVSSGIRFVIFCHKITLHICSSSTVALPREVYIDLCEFVRDFVIEFNSLEENQRLLVERLSDSLKVRDLKRG